MGRDTGGAVRAAGTPPERPVPLLEILGLTTLAVTQPVLDIFTKGADAFGAEDPGTLGIVAFALVIALGPALVLWLVDLALAGSGRGPAPGPPHAARRPRRTDRDGRLKRSSDLDSRPLLACGAVVGGGVLVVAARWLLVRRWLRALSLASVVFVLTFLLTPPSTLWPSAGSTRRWRTSRRNGCPR